ncbi:hypothetical protein, conserved [Babesia bigemina]|uniref:Uncharacterized protein n=1 Tax=Babesia bigemina TaxID=5866 RepID=A0A061D376_BABBI|nr:hypothetical protein, conserved [Babesia bigemina]CDR95058.1 hypothetical protein, conserved [Babesia bigemina]|eukprot:XP_012767244.1 hypothetical protein, conserved [Babesia bigemina]
MRTQMRGRPPRYSDLSEDYVVGEILEDIECLQIDVAQLEEYDDLNDDTFGDGIGEEWDPSETFLAAEREPVVRRPARKPRELVKCELFDFPEPTRAHRQQNNRNQSQRQNQRRSQNQQSDNSQNTNAARRADRSPRGRRSSDETDEVEHKRSFISDLNRYRRLGMFTLNPRLVELVAAGKRETHHRWRISQRTLERHARGVKRTPENMERELFMDDHAFDQILRIHLAQTCKDPRLQNYTGRWNTRHLGINPPRDAASPGDADPDETQPASPEHKSVVNPNRFGKTSAASVRYGRKLIRLDEVVTSPSSGPVCMERQLRETIELGYEALYTLCDIEEDIEQCPMNHVAALDKMQKERDGKLNQLFLSLTTGNVSVESIMELNKGRVLMIKLGRKLSIETKLQLACCIVDCMPAFARICAAVDEALAGEATLLPLIEVLSSATDMKPLVAFERDDVHTHPTGGVLLQHRLRDANSYTQCFLLIIESLTLTGHLFLLTAETGGRQTALQRCCNILLRWQQACNVFVELLRHRGGVIFMNVLLERIQDSPVAVDKESVDMILHYTLEASEQITAHGDEWRSLASSIMRMFQ